VGLPILRLLAEKNSEMSLGVTVGIHRHVLLTTEERFRVRFRWMVAWLNPRSSRKWIEKLVELIGKR